MKTGWSDSPESFHPVVHLCPVPSCWSLWFDHDGQPTAELALIAPMQWLPWAMVDPFRCLWGPVRVAQQNGRGEWFYLFLAAKSVKIRFFNLIFLYADLLNLSKSLTLSLWILSMLLEANIWLNWATKLDVSHQIIIIFYKVNCWCSLFCCKCFLLLLLYIVIVIDLLLLICST